MGIRLVGRPVTHHNSAAELLLVLEEVACPTTTLRHLRSLVDDMPYVYKYFSDNLLPIAFSKPGYCGLKCSLPKDYNDPYELFLRADLKVGPEGLATYKDIIQTLPQFQTACFSKSPVVSPMWAHYANNHTGFVLEFDADFLLQTFQEASLRDVTYRVEPSQRN